MKAFGLIGDPVDHSLSPVMHRAAFRELGLEADYVLVRVASDSPRDLPAAVRSLAASGGGNVTLPHKRAVAALLDSSSDDVRLTGACNCFWSDGSGGVVGDNTDVGGVLAVLKSMPRLDPVGASVLIVGAGGAAAAAAVAAGRAGAATISVLNRRTDRAVGLVRRLDPSTPAAISVAPRETHPGDFDLVIQATSLGLHPADPLPCEFGENPPAHTLDLVYAPGETVWVRQARAGGSEAIDGLAVLWEQGVLSLERWLGRPMSPAVRSVMWEALESVAR